jgi:NAD(P)H dehydrogenase (quinone)
MGGPAAQFKAFADATSERWFKRVRLNKLAAGFTVSGGPSGDKLSFTSPSAATIPLCT